MQNSKNEQTENSLLNSESTTTQDAARQNVDISAPGVAKQLARRIADDIDEYVIRSYDGGHRNHLGASLIGDECKRKLWYIFRWCYRDMFGDQKNRARMQRLFNRGHREEDRFVEWLEGIGVKIWFENYAGLVYRWHIAEGDTYFIAEPGYILQSGEVFITEQDADFKKHVARAKADGIKFPQYRVSGSMGHFGGSLDGIVQLPERYGIPGYLLAEFKTNGTGAGFNKLVEAGMPVAKQNHFAQKSTYGGDPQYQFTHVLYLNINKNDDSLHVEIVKLDWNIGNQMRQKADQIIMSQVPPPRLSDNPTFRTCVYCAAKDICHKRAMPEKNCRSCVNAKPVENGEWFCTLPQNNGVIPKDFIPKGCGDFYPITVTPPKN